MTTKNTIKYWKRLQKQALTFVMGVFVFFACYNTAVSQNTVTGSVIDAQTGEALPGVNIVVEGTTIGTSTNLDGNYEIDVPSLDDTIIYTFVGYISLTEAINGRTQIDVALLPDVRMLDDVVVIGYGTQERQQITGSVSSVSTEAFVTGNVERATDLIQGKIPGLVVSQSRGADPNSPPEIRLRGVSTFGAQQSPLVVIDGVIGASLENIDPNDIQTIDVLKDASASAIYGTRGAAGVIQVTTKRGSTGQTNVSYNSTFTTTGVENRIETLSGDEWRQLGQELGIAVVDFGSDTDWFEEITQRGNNSVHSLAISGGSEATTYRVSGNYRTRKGLLQTTGNEVKSGRLNINHRALNERLALSINLSATTREEDRGFPNAFDSAITYNPTAPSGNDNLTDFFNTGGWHYTSTSGMTNPSAILHEQTNQREDRRLNASLRGEYYFDELLPGLTASAQYSYETLSRTDILYATRQGESGGGATQITLGSGNIDRRYSDSSNELFESTLNYVTNLERLDIELLGGYSYQYFFNAFNRMQGSDFLPLDPGPANIGLSQSIPEGRGIIQSNESDNKLIGGFARLSLNFDNTYFFNSSFRREGSTRFGPGNKWGNFYSAGLGVELTNIFDLGQDVNSLRFRTSYGVTGQDAPFSGISQFRLTSAGSFLVDGNFLPAFGPNSNSNPDLKWEESSEFNIGAEFSMLDNRLSGSFEYYNKTTADLLFEREVPVPPFIFPTRWENIGEIENKGFEFAISYDVIRQQDRAWNTGITFATFESVLTQFVDEGARYLGNMGAPGQSTVTLVRVREGEPLGQIWGAKFVGLDSNGRSLYEAEDGSSVTSDLLTRADEQVIGNGLPDFTFGWDNRVNFKNWDFNLFIRGSIGHDVANTPRGFYENPAIIQSRNALKSALDHKDFTSQALFNSYHVEDASFARIQNLSIGYTFPINNPQIRRIRLYASANNLYTLTNYTGMNPDVRYSDRGNPLIIGIERPEEWYTERSFTIGLNLDF